jgi:hypothetical protein
MIETILDPSQILGSGYTVDMLAFCLEYAIRLNPNERFGYFKPVPPEMDRSIRLFGQHPFEDSAPFPRPLTPRELALELLKYTNASKEKGPARYPINPRDEIMMKGWTISQCADVVDEKGHPLIAAYAAWIKP